MDTENPTYTLNDGTSLPAIALGTYNLRGSGGVDAVVSALHVGYRLIDSAFNYENEGLVGEAVRRAGVPRDELRLVSKLPGRHHRYEEAVYTVEESLYRAGLDYWDLYLVHWPNPRIGLYVEAFQALVDLRERGLIRSVGVSNFLPEHLHRVIDEVGVTPSVNQIQVLPTWPQEDMVALDRDLGIRTEAWSPIGRGGEVVGDPVVTRIAGEVGRTPVQVILRWHVQRGVVPLPKSANPGHQAQNLDVFDFELTDAQMAALTGMARPDGRALDIDPSDHEEF